MDPSKLHEFLWNAMVPASKMTASQLGVHTKDNDALTHHIYTRLKIMYGHIESENQKDEFMGSSPSEKRNRQKENDQQQQQQKTPWKIIPAQHARGKVIGKEDA